MEGKNTPFVPQEGECVERIRIVVSMVNESSKLWRSGVGLEFSLPFWGGLGKGFTSFCCPEDFTPCIPLKGELVVMNKDPEKVLE